MQHFRR